MPILIKRGVQYKYSSLPTPEEIFSKIICNSPHVRDVVIDDISGLHYARFIFDTSLTFTCTDRIYPCYKSILVGGGGHGGSAGYAQEQYGQGGFGGEILGDALETVNVGVYSLVVGASKDSVLTEPNGYRGTAQVGKRGADAIVNMSSQTDGTGGYVENGQAYGQGGTGGIGFDGEAGYPGNAGALILYVEVQ